MPSLSPAQTWLLLCTVGSLGCIDIDRGSFNGPHDGKEREPCAPAERCTSERVESLMPGSAPGNKPVAFSYSNIDDDSAFETFLDKVTLLEWQRYADDDDHSWQAANKHCQELDLDRHDDWRLPTRAELTTLLDPGRSTKSIYDKFGSLTGGALYWSSTPVLSPSWAPTLNEDDHYIVALVGLVVPETNSEELSVRCVRWVGPPRAETQRYTLQGTTDEPVMLDERTKIAWQERVPELPAGCSVNAATKLVCKQSEAQQYCDQLSYGGFDDWRLPTLKDALTLYDPTLVTGLDPVLFSERRAEVTWTSTAHVDMPTQYFYVQPNATSYTDPTGEFGVRCMR